MDLHLRLTHRSPNMHAWMRLGETDGEAVHWNGERSTQVRF